MQPIANQKDNKLKNYNIQSIVPKKNGLHNLLSSLLKYKHINGKLTFIGK